MRVWNRTTRPRRRKVRHDSHRQRDEFGIARQGGHARIYSLVGQARSARRCRRGGRRTLRSRQGAARQGQGRSGGGRTITETFDERLAKRTDALSEKLSKIFDKMNIPPEYATHLKVDKFGNVSAEGPWKEKIEKMFRDSPELAKELKDVSGLSSLKAAQTALDMYNEAKKSSNKQEQAEAWKTYNIRSINIQALSGVMTMKDGKLRSAAVDYIDMLADPNGLASGKSGKAVTERLV
jgi:hypothetical protein